MQPQPLTPAEERQIAAEKARIAADHANVERSQDRYATVLAGQSSEGGPSVPVVPTGAIIYLPKSHRRRYESKEHSEARAGLAAQLKDARAAAVEAEKKQAKVTALQAKLADRRKKFDALGVGEKVEERADMERQAALLQADLGIANQAYISARQRIAGLEAAARDPLVQWCEARRDYCAAAIPILTAALDEASEILRYKAEELETGQPHPGAHSAKDLPASEAIALPPGFVNWGTLRETPK